MSNASLQSSQLRRLWRELFLSPLFLVVLALKLIAGSILAGELLRGSFTPFVDYFVRSGFMDPWQHYFELASLKAFPYPPGMLYILSLPRMLFSFLPPGFELLQMRLPMLAGDLAIYTVLGLWFRDRVSTVRFWYWCSPIAFYVCYVHGQLDIIPTALFVLSLFFLERRRFMAGMLIYGLALSTKNHLWIAFPFLLIYLRQRMEMGRLLAGMAVAVSTYALLVSPFYFEPAFKAMVVHAEEQAWVFSMALAIGKWDTAVLLCPAALLFVFVKYAVYPRQNWDLTQLFLGIVFCAFIVLVPPMPGWYLWSLPFIIYYFCRFQRSPAILLMVLSAAYLAYFLLGSRSDLSVILAGLNISFTPPVFLERWMGVTIDPVVNNLYFTLLQTSVVAAVLVMYTKGVRSNEVYGPRARPTLIGIAGDSGVGKDRIAALLTALLGERDVIRLEGDDYHRWERGDENWKVLTHLNPKSNRLHEQLEHTVALRGGQGIVKVAYDHGSGKFTAKEAVDPRKNIIVQGLHSFLLEQQRNLFDLRVFLDPDEKLRVFWKLRRDYLQRGHKPAKVLANIKKRAADRAASVLPQKGHADIVFSFKPKHAAALKNLKADPELYLEILARNSFNLEDLARMLAEQPGIQVEVDYPKGIERIRLKVSGSISPEQVDRLALDLVPNLADLAGTQPQFTGGLDGVMLLAALIALSASLRWNGSRASV